MSGGYPLRSRDPDHRTKVIEGPYPELIRLVNLVGDDEIFAAGDDNLRIRRGGGQALLLDELAA